MVTGSVTQDEQPFPHLTWENISTWHRITDLLYSQQNLLLEHFESNPFKE